MKNCPESKGGHGDTLGVSDHPCLAIIHALESTHREGKGAGPDWIEDEHGVRIIFSMKTRNGDQPSRGRSGGIQRQK